MEKPKITNEVRYALAYLFNKFEGHSDYHGDSILVAIQCVSEGKEIGTVKPID